VNNTNIRNKTKKPFIRNESKAKKLKSEPTKVSAVENISKNEKSKKQQNGNKKKKSFKNRHISTNNKNATRFKI
jgi:hypothetical protein